jgi:hypothetical protein
MTERTVTEKNIRDALKNRNLNPDHLYFKTVLDELFPELPKANELVLIWDKGSTTVGGWLPFVKIRDDGRVIVLDEDGNDELWDEYRRQTPAERGEG